jgi:ABC-type sugar transport system ATPase subunit
MTTSADSPGKDGRRCLLELRSLSKTFGAVRALRGVDIVLHEGEVLGLVGDNGAGKSTLVNIIAGTLRPDHGELILDGVVHLNETPSDARHAGIETVFQSLSLISALDIAENVYLNREVFRFGPFGRRLRWMDKPRMRREAEEGLARLGLTLPPPRTKVAALSGGQRQAVAVARAVFWGSRIVLMDEPTAALGVRQTEIVLSFIEQLKEHGVAVLFVSHNMQHVLRVSDRIVVLRLGRKVLDAARGSVGANKLVAAIMGASEG